MRIILVALIVTIMSNGLFADETECKFYKSKIAEYSKILNKLDNSRDSKHKEYTIVAQKHYTKMYNKCKD